MPAHKEDTAAKILIVVFGLFLFAEAAYAWTGPPSGTPPACTSGNPGCDAPLNLSNNYQIKQGNLMVNAGNSYTNGLLVPYGKVGIGTVNPGYPLDVNGAVNATQYCISGANCISVWPSGGAGTYLPLAGGTMNSGAAIGFSGGTTYGVKSNDLYIDTLNTGITNDPLEINYRTAGPVKVCASASCATYSAIFNTDQSISIGGNLTFAQSNPTLSAPSYLTIPGGAYFNSGTVYAEAPIQARGGIHDDTHTNLTISGGTSGNTVFSSGLINVSNYIQVNGKYAIDGTDSWLRLNQQGSFSSGTYTPYNFRADGGIVSGGLSGLGAGTIQANGNIVNSNPTQGNIGLTGDLPGYSTGVYPTLKTSGQYLYFSANGVYSGYWYGADFHANGGIYGSGVYDSNYRVYSAVNPPPAQSKGSLSCTTYSAYGNPVTAYCGAGYTLTGGSCSGFTGGCNGVPNMSNNSFYSSGTTDLNPGYAYAICCKVQ